MTSAHIDPTDQFRPTWLHGVSRCMRWAYLALAVFTWGGLSAQDQVPVAKAVLPAEPVAQLVNKTINVLDLIRGGKVEYHVSSKADVNDAAKEVFTFQPDGMFHISGRGYGGVTTNDSFKDYHLVIEFMWG